MAATDTVNPPAEVPAPPEKAPEPIKTPFRAPASTSEAVPARPELSAEEKAKYERLLSRARAFTEVKVESATAKTGSGPITDGERMWLTRECLVRYLRATRWDEKESERRLLLTLAWRREFGVGGLTAEHVSAESETGKLTLLGFDLKGRPCNYLSPGRQNTEPTHGQVEQLVFMLERGIEMMPAGQETLALLINFKQDKKKNTTPGIGMAREVLSILQLHYPERLGRALIINVPWFVWGFFKLITPFIDPRTVAKLKFNEDMTQYVAPGQLWTEFQPQGGLLDFEYDHAEYWPVLNRLCGEVRAERAERWAAGGKLVGESEDYLCGGVEVGVGGAAKVSGTEPEDLGVAGLKIEEPKAGEGKESG